MDNLKPDFGKLAQGDCTRFGLMKRYGIDVVPHGWDATDLAMVHARLGLQRLRDHVRETLARQGDVRPPSAFQGVVDRARDAMNARQNAARGNPASAADPSTG